MEKFIQEFTKALNGGRGALDAWLECNNEADCRAAINGYVQDREAELVGHVERLREALNGCLFHARRNGEVSVSVVAKEALSATPSQSLARLRNEVLEKCEAMICKELFDSTLRRNLIEKLHAMKEPE